MVCPKCGSDQILHDQCLKCGVIISKVHRANPSAETSGPISFVNPSTTANDAPPVVSRPGVTAEMSRSARRAEDLKRNIVITIILLLIAGGIYRIYLSLMHRVSSFSGLYRNTEQIFAIRFPEAGWSHYRPGDLKSKEFKDAKDAFYKGDDPDDPDVRMLIWIEPTRKPVPDRMDQETADRLLQAIEKELQIRMKKSEMECDILESGRLLIGSNDGFYLRANLKGKKVEVKTMIYCAFNGNRAFTIQFLGKDKDLIENQAEIESIIKSLGFDIRLV